MSRKIGPRPSVNYCLNMADRNTFAFIPKDLPLLNPKRIILTTDLCK